VDRLKFAINIRIPGIRKLLKGVPFKYDSCSPNLPPSALLIMKRPVTKEVSDNKNSIAININLILFFQLQIII
jgi:hypothetical protein